MRAGTGTTRTMCASQFTFCCMRGCGGVGGGLLIRIGWLYRHPVTNEYLPIQCRGEEYLRKEGDTSDKVWDEDALRQWEHEENGGRSWAGRPPED